MQHHQRTRSHRVAECSVRAQKLASSLPCATRSGILQTASFCPDRAARPINRISRTGQGSSNDPRRWQLRAKSFWPCGAEVLKRANNSGLNQLFKQIVPNLLRSLTPQVEFAPLHNATASCQDASSPIVRFEFERFIRLTCN